MQDQCRRGRPRPRTFSAYLVERAAARLRTVVKTWSLLPGITGRTLSSLPLLGLIRAHPLPAAIGLAAVSYWGLFPLVALLHQASILALAAVLQATAASRLLKHLLTGAGFDPVYASVFNRMVGNIEARGLAIAGPLGDALHQLAPGVFFPPTLVQPGAWVTALVNDGASLLASVITMVGAEALLVAVGLTTIGLRKKAPGHLRLGLIFLGLMLQLRGIIGLLSIQVPFHVLEAMGLSYILTKLLPIAPRSYDDMVQSLGGVGTYMLPLATMASIYGMALVVRAIPILKRRNGGLAGSLRRLARAWLRQVMSYKAGGWKDLALATAVVAAMSLAVLPSLRLLPAQANYDYQIESDVASPPLLEEPAFLPDRVEPAPKPGPSKVAISGADYSYTYTVNGRRQRIHGLGYNVMYSHLSAPERSARYDRDFAQMKLAGVNTILGWEREQFDEVTLEKAQEYDLGVVLPYYLPRNGAYADPAYQEMVRGDMEGWVKRFRGYPALRMWGIGNEVIHGMGKNPNTPQARAFAQFYVELADRVRALDPDHPVVYRDAEDIYVGPMREALKRDGVRRPWFVYGTNFFTFRICEVLRDWRQRGLDVPLLVSEFAPSGLARQDRPKGYLKMWRCIREQPDTVLGGFAYVWTTNGPEAIDRVLGLVDGEGQAVDGSLAALGRAFPWDGDNPP